MLPGLHRRSRLRASGRARQIWDTKTVSALEKKPKYRALLASHLQLFEWRTGAGLYLGTGSMLQADAGRIEVLRRNSDGSHSSPFLGVLGDPGFPAFRADQILRSDDLAPWRPLLPSLKIRRLGHIVYTFGQAIDEPRGVVGLLSSSIALHSPHARFRRPRCP